MEEDPGRASHLEIRYAIPAYLILLVNLAAGWKKTREQFRDQFFNLVFFNRAVSFTVKENLRKADEFFSKTLSCTSSLFNKENWISKQLHSFWWLLVYLTHTTAEQQSAARLLFSTSQYAAQYVLRLIFKWKPP